MVPFCTQTDNPSHRILQQSWTENGETVYCRHLFIQPLNH